MTQVPVRVLGGVRLEGPSGEVRVGGVLAERLLGALVSVGGAPILTDVLAEVLWPTAPPSDPAPPLRMVVSRLRHRLAEVGIPDAVVATRRAYRLSVAGQLIDVERFTSLVDGARRLTPIEPDRAAAMLDGALALWRGAPFGELASEPWATGPVTHLLSQRMAAEEELAELDLARHREAAVVDRLRLAVDAQPLRERRWVQLATALYRLGRQADALRAVDEARTILREELGIDPGEDLRTVHRALLNQDPTLLASDAILRTSLPSPERLVGRGVDVNEIERLLDANRLVTVHGLGGVGKSAIARAVAGSSQSGRGVMVAQLSGIADGEAVWLAVAAAVGLPGAEHPADLPAAIVARLSTRSVLLVLDGAEAGAETVAEVADTLLLMAPSLKVLVTSRVPIGATGEVRYALGALHIGDGDLDASAVELFLDRAGVSPGGLDDVARGAVVRVCELAGGLPLALELAAASTDLHGLAGMATGEPAKSGAVVLHEMVCWSLDVLPEESRQLLARTTLLPHGVSTTAAARLGDVPAGGVRRLLAPLVQARLLGAVDGGSTGLRYAAPEAIREVAGELLTEADAHVAGSLVVGHLLAITTAVGGLDDRLRTTAVPLVEVELPNVRHWLGRSLGTADGLKLAVSAASTLFEIGLGSEGRRWLQRHRDAFPEAEPLLQARTALASSALSQELLLNVPELEQAAVVMEDHEAWRGWLCLRGYLAVTLGRLDSSEALKVLHDPVLLERMAIVGDPWFDVQRDWIVGVLPASIGQFAEARANTARIPDRFLALDDPSSALFALFVRGFLARWAGDVNGAERDLFYARELAATSGAKGSQARIAAEVAHVARTRGDPAAVSMLLAAIDLLERAGVTNGAAVARRDLGGWRLADGDVVGGLRDLRAVLPMLLRIDRQGAAVALAEMAVAVAEARPRHGARFAGAAAGLIAEPGAAAPAQRARVDDVAHIVRESHEDAFAEGGRLDDEALIELCLA